MLKVMTIVGTRPEIIKLSRVMAELDKYTEHIMVHTGQNFDYELNEIFFQELRIRKPDYFLDAAGKNAAESCRLVQGSAGRPWEDPLRAFRLNGRHLRPSKRERQAPVITGRALLDAH